MAVSRWAAVAASSARAVAGFGGPVAAAARPVPASAWATTTAVRGAAVRSFGIEVDVGTAPLAADTAVNVVFVNYAGDRQVLCGRVGQSLTEVAVDNEYPHLLAVCGGGGSTYAIKHNDEWTEDQYGEGAFCSYCQVVLAPVHAEMVPAPLKDERERLDQTSGISDTTRLGCQIKLTKSMDGMVVHVPDSGYEEIP